MVLGGVGGSLVGFVIGLYCLDMLFNWNRSFGMGVTSSTPAQVAAIKVTINYYVSFAAKSVGVLALGLSFLDVPFNVATFCLGAV